MFFFSRALDQDQYNYITATYYLLAERLLKKEYLKRKRLKFKYHNKKAKKPNHQNSGDVTLSIQPIGTATTTMDVNLNEATLNGGEGLNVEAIRNGKSNLETQVSDVSSKNR